MKRSIREVLLLWIGRKSGVRIWPCPIDGWTGDFYRIHSERIKK